MTNNYALKWIGPNPNVLSTQPWSLSKAAPLLQQGDPGKDAPNSCDI